MHSRATIIYTALLITALTVKAQSTAQWHYIMTSLSSNDLNDSSGYYFFATPNNYKPGDIFEKYKDLSGDTLSSFIPTRHWIDSMVYNEHYEYQHYFMGIPVYAGTVREHFKNEGLYLFHGKIGYFDGVDTIDLNNIVHPDTAVRRFLLAEFGYPYNLDYFFAWESSAWQEQIKNDLGTDSASWYPKAKLVWISPNIGYTPGPYLPNQKLAYAIRVFCLKPFFDRTYFVNAFKPEEVILYLSEIATHTSEQSLQEHDSVQLARVIPQRNSLLVVTAEKSTVIVSDELGKTLSTDICDGVCKFDLSNHRGLVFVKVVASERRYQSFKLIIF